MQRPGGTPLGATTQQRLACYSQSGVPGPQQCHNPQSLAGVWLGRQRLQVIDRLVPVLWFSS